MATKHIDGRELVSLVARDAEFADIVRIIKQPPKVVDNAMSREIRHGYLDYGVSLRRPWVTKKGLDWLSSTPMGG